MLDADVVVELAELRARTPPVPYPILSEYLKDEHNLIISGGAIQKHFQNGHKP